MDVTLLIVYAVVAIAFSFVCSIAEAVLLSITPSYIASLKEEGRGAYALMEHLKTNIDRPLAAILSLNTIAHTAGAAGVGAQAASIWEGAAGLAVGYASAVMTLLILVLSEIIPKTIGAVYWRGLAGITARFVQILIWVLYPLVWASELITKLISGDNHQHIVTREEIAAMAAMSAAGGYLGTSESRVLSNMLRLRSLTVHDIMTPRTVLQAFSEDTTVEEALASKTHQSLSRWPVYSESIDHIGGFVLKDEVLLASARGETDKPLSELRRPIKAVAESTPLIEVFDSLLDDRAHLAVVIDEYGGTDGLVTLEDVIETLLGMEIVDEADATTDMQKLARQQWKRRAEALGLELQEESDDTGSGRKVVVIDGDPPTEDEPGDHNKTD